MRNLFSVRQRRSVHQKLERFIISNVVSHLHCRMLCCWIPESHGQSLLHCSKLPQAFANEMQGKRSHVTAHVENAGRSRRDSRGQRSERPARAGRGQAPSSSEKKEAPTRTMWCRAERRCDSCFQQGHVRASCPNAASPEQRQQALSAYAAWKKSRKGPKPHFRK